jgi:hypothetical protein
MAQGYSSYTIVDSGVSIKDGPNLDAFSRLRVSQPVTAFSSQFTYNLNPLLFEQVASGTGATVTHDTTNRNTLLTFASTPTGGQAFMQSYEFIPYQPSKSQLVFITFNMIAAVANTLKFAGLSDGNNGIEFQLNGTTRQFVIYSDTTLGDQTVVQSSWNLDKLDGTGSSGITLDVTKTQILVIDFQALYVGRVRVGFDIDGQIIYCHEFLHANLVEYPYIQTANLPVRVGMTCTGTVSTTMNFICSAVVSEGGIDSAALFGYDFVAANSTDISVTTSPTHMLSIRPRTTFNSITNRIKLIPTGIDIIITGSGTNIVFWELVVGQTLTSGVGAANVNTTYSGTEVLTGGVMSGSPIVIDSGYATSSNQSKASFDATISTRYPLTLDRSGANRDLGQLTLRATSIVGGTFTCRGLIRFKEIR